MRPAPMNSIHRDVSFVEYTSLSLQDFSPSGSLLCVDIDGDGRDEILFTAHEDRSMGMIKDGIVYLVAEFESAFPIVSMAVCNSSPSCDSPNNTLLVVRMDGSVYAYAMGSATAASPPSYSLLLQGHVKAPAAVKHMQTFTWEHKSTYEEAATPCFSLLDTLQISSDSDADTISYISVLEGEFLLVGFKRGSIAIYQLLAAIPRRITQEDFLAESPLTISMKLELRDVPLLSALPLPLFACPPVITPFSTTFPSCHFFGVCWLDGRVCLCVIEDHAIPTWRSLITLQTSIPASSLSIIPYFDPSPIPESPLPSPRRRREAMCQPSTSRSSEDNHTGIDDKEISAGFGNNGSSAAILSDDSSANSLKNNDVILDDNGSSSGSSSFVVIDEDTPPAVSGPASQEVSPAPNVVVPPLLLIASGVSGQTLFLTVPHAAVIGRSALDIPFTVFCFNAATRFAVPRGRGSGIMLTSAIKRRPSSTGEASRDDISLSSYDLLYLSSTDRLFVLSDIGTSLTRLNVSGENVVATIFNREEVETAGSWRIQEVGSVGHISRNAHRVSTATCTLYNDEAAKTKPMCSSRLINILMRMPENELASLHKSIRDML